MEDKHRTYKDLTEYGELKGYLEKWTVSIDILQTEHW